jgi:hypothetical protein
MVMVLLLVGFFVSAEAADPQEASGRDVAHRVGCGNKAIELIGGDGTAALDDGSYGTCNDIDCCGGRPKALCATFM